MATIFKFPDGLYPSKNNNTLNIFKSSYWDTNSVGGGVLTNEQMNRGDLSVILRDFQIDGNYRNNVIPDVNTATCTGLGTLASPETAGSDSWGHGIAFYGTNLICENLYIHSCPGAGIIIQGTAGGGSAWGYPLNTFTNFGGGPGAVNGGVLISYVMNTWCVANGRQGLLLRSFAYVNRYWSYWNGEAGIDVQACAYFGGGGWISEIEVFEDSWHHGAQQAPQNTTYDPLGFEMRLLNGSWLSDAWIEPSMGNSDNLMIGSNGAISNPTGYQISTGVNHIHATNVHLDYPRAAAIHMGGGNSILRGIKVQFAPQNVTYTLATPMRLIGGNNDIELNFEGFNTSTLTGGVNGTGTLNGVQIGTPTQLVWGNRLILYSDNNDYVIDNQNTGSISTIDATLVDTTASTKYFLKPAGAALDYTKNKIRVNTIGHWAGSSVGTRSENGGTATFSGTGSQTIFNIPHLLFDTPLVYNVNAKSAAATALFNVSADATNVIVTYNSAPVSGTNNVVLVWNARVSS
jgi:hypothetical protein